MKGVLGLGIGTVLSAVLIVLALPLGERFYLAWFAVVPLLIVSRDRGFLTGFVMALVAIFLAAWLSSMGIFYSHHYPEGNVAWVYTGFGLFGFSLAIVMGMASEREAWHKPAWWFAAMATLLEACLLLQLPAHLALSQYRCLPMLLVASVGGIWLVTFLVWWANFALARLTWRPLSIAIVVVVFVGLSTVNLSLPEGGDKHRYAAVQVQEAEDNKLLELHTLASQAHSELVVWPEFSALGLVIDDDTGQLRALSRERGSSPFVTTFRDTHQPLPHNIAGLFANGRELGRYAKRKPFGAETSMHKAGKDPIATSLGGRRVGLNICFDSCYPYVIRDTCRLPGVNVIALPAIDPVAPNHFIAAMHAAFTPFRAVENGVVFIRSDGYAYSQIVSPLGRIAAEQPPGVGVLVAEVSDARRWTLCGALGDWFLYVCFVLALAGWLGPKVRKPHEARVH